MESKIIKTISLIYILEQFECLKPTKEEIIGIFSASYSVEEIESAINDLIEKEYVVYLRRSNDYLRLKQTSGVDVKQKIHDLVEAQASRVSVKEVLNLQQQMTAISVMTVDFPWISLMQGGLSRTCYNSI